MQWVQLKMALGGLNAAKLEDSLVEAGAISVTLDDAGDEPLYEPDPLKPPLWTQTRLTALFAADADLDGVRAYLLATLGLKHLPEHAVQTVADRDWEREWLKDFKPMRFGRRLWVCPTGFTPPDPQAVNLLLDPGLAFGTGTHATTALCLEWLDSAGLTGLSVIDYGCGSGILAIAAARLGAKYVLAVDHDPQAITATRDNAERNGVTHLIRASQPEALPDNHVDLLLANILAGPLVNLAPLFARRLKPGGRLVLSGILKDQEQELREAYGAHFDSFETAKREDWLRITATRKPD
jgi:ribosomal protein L11 methyltransferase